jgi:peptidase E
LYSPTISNNPNFKQKKYKILQKYIKQQTRKTNKIITYHPQASITYKTRKAIKENIDNLSMKQQADKYNIALHTVSRWRNREDFYDKKHEVINPSKPILTVFY